MILFDIYDVQPGDTLKKIGENIGMSAEEVRDFHNRNCSIYGLPWFSSLLGIQKIVLHKNYINSEKVQSENSTSLPNKQYRSGFHSENYTVTEIFTDLNNENSKFDYEIVLKSDIQEDTNIISIKKNNLKFNDQLPDDKMSKLALECTRSIEPIYIELSEGGSPAAIGKHKEIKQRFLNKRDEIADFYCGEVSNLYLNKFEENISSEEFLLKQLCSTLLYQTLFPEMEWFQNKRVSTGYFSIVQNSFSVKCQFTFEYDAEESDVIETVIKGKLLDKYSLNEILKGVKYEEESEDLAEVELNFNYFTNKSTKVLESAVGEIILFHDDQIYQKHKINIEKI